MNLKLIDAALAAYHDTLDEGDLGRLAFFRKIWDVQEDIAGRGIAQYAVPDAESLRTGFDAGKPILTYAPARIDAEGFAQAIGDIATCIIEHGGFPAGTNEALARTNWSRIVAASDLSLAGIHPPAYIASLPQLFADDGMDERPAATASYAAHYALRGVLDRPSQEALQALREAVSDDAAHPVHCPFCGAEPSVASVGVSERARGRGKELWCPQCGATWKFDRIRCPRCGTRNQGHLHYFNIEGDEAHRIATCDACGGYIRSVYPSDELAPFSYEVEDVVMAKLDLIAMQKVAQQAQALGATFEP